MSTKMKNKRSLADTASSSEEWKEKMESKVKKPTLERGEDKKSVLPEGSRLKERLLSALESGVWADCKFLVGESKEEVTACKMILSLASPVFCTMFFGSVPENQPVLVPDIEPEVFNKMLQFIYVHDVQIDFVKEALDVMVAAHKYMLPDLVHKCSDFCIENFNEYGKDMSDFCSMLETAKLLNVEKLQEASMRKAQELTSTLLFSSEFLTLSADSVVSILRRGHLNIDSELQLINAAMGWASNRCEQTGISIEGKALRSVLEEVGAFKHLRFLNLTQQQLIRFESDPKKRGVLTVGEMEAIKKYHDSNNDEPPPDSVCNLNTPRNRNLSTASKELHVRQGKFLNKITSLQSVTEKYTIREYWTGSIYGVTIATRVREFEYGSHYEEELTINVSCNRNNISGYFKGTVKYGDEVTVLLERELESNQLGGEVKISVTIHFWKAGTYPVFKKLEGSNGCLETTGHIIKFNYR